MKKCINCEAIIEEDDNFCFQCGHWTPRGYVYFNENSDNIKQINGNTVKQNNRMTTLFFLMSITIISFVLIITIRGQDIMKPFVYLKKQAFNYKYGYNTSLIVNNNQYNKVEVNSLEEANKLIKEDIKKQEWQCENNYDVYKMEQELIENYNIKSVNFCDVSTTEVKKIKSVIDEIYSLFPTIKGHLNNITITNANTNDEYIAYFEPIYQFVNSNEKIEEYNKVNKIQILLNSYYFLNEEILALPLTNLVGENWYVKDATYESLIAHELGHYITYVSLLKEYNIPNLTFITKDNYNDFDKVLEIINDGSYSNKIVNESLNNYNKKNNSSLNLNEFAKNISLYAATTDESGKINSDEAIAEAIHDYYLHKENASKSSIEIVNVLKNKI